MNIRLQRYSLLSIIILGFARTINSGVEKKYRLAFVKQIVYQDLYCTNARNPAEIIFSTFRRSGPVALFSALNTDFFIVDTEPDPECEIWKEKAVSQKGIAYYESLRTTIPPDGILSNHQHPQGYYAVPCNSINWNNYDIVISMDIAIPKRIVKQYPHVLWAYYIGEGSQPSYRKSFDKPLAGYDLFLTQDFGTNPSYKKHVIDFPYHLHYFGCFHELLGISPHYLRSGIFLDVHTRQVLSNKHKKQLSNIVPINMQKSERESFTTMFNRLCTTKYYIIYLKPAKEQCIFRRGITEHRYTIADKNRTSVRGNAIPEAIASGNLVIAQSKCLKNTSLLSKKTIVDSFQELLEKLKYFEENPIAYQEELEQQRKKLNWYCFERPMKELYTHYENKKTSNT